MSEQAAVRSSGQHELHYASSSVQGRRPYNEDRSHSVHPLPFAPSSSSERCQSSLTSFFAVFDGHGGEEAAEWCSRHLHDCIAAQPEYASDDNKHAAITAGFMQCDARLLSAAVPIGSSGTTCGCVLIDDAFIYSGNCGDTRNLLVRANQPPLELTVDHKPTDPDERRRIEAGGGVVTVSEVTVGRNGRKQVITQSYVELGEAGLAVSRAFGDASFKRNKQRGDDEQVVICRPYVSRCPRSADDDFLILASDGLWNFVDSDRVVAFIRERLASDDPSERDLDDIVNKLTQHALDKKSNDNVTVTLVVFPRSMQLAASKHKQHETKSDAPQ